MDLAPLFIALVSYFLYQTSQVILDSCLFPASFRSMSFLELYIYFWVLSTPEVVHEYAVTLMQMMVFLCIGIAIQEEKYSLEPRSPQQKVLWL